MQRAELTNVEIDRVHERRVTRLRKPEVEARQPTTPDATDQQFLIPPKVDLISAMSARNVSPAINSSGDRTEHFGRVFVNLRV